MKLNEQVQQCARVQDEYTKKLLYSHIVAMNI